MISLSLSLLFLTAPAFAISPDELQPMEKWAYDTYVKQGQQAKADAYLASRGWLKECEAVLLDDSKAKALTDRPAALGDFKFSEAEQKHIDEALKLRELAKAGKLKPRKKAVEAKPVALKPATAAFLKELGIDPKSAEVTAVSGEQVKTKDGEVYSLDSIAADRDRRGMKRFIATRNFVRAFRKDPKTPFPPRDLYETSLLTREEVQFISMSLRQNLAK